MANEKTIHKSVVIIVFQYISVTVTHWKDESDFSYPILIIVWHLKSVTGGKNKTKKQQPHGLPQEDKLNFAGNTSNKTN